MRIRVTSNSSISATVLWRSWRRVGSLKNFWTISHWSTRETVIWTEPHKTPCRSTLENFQVVQGPRMPLTF